MEHAQRSTNFVSFALRGDYASIGCLEEGILESRQHRGLGLDIRAMEWTIWHSDQQLKCLCSSEYNFEKIEATLH